jgi:hypothetical protein
MKSWRRRVEYIRDLEDYMAELLVSVSDGKHKYCCFELYQYIQVSFMSQVSAITPDGLVHANYPHAPPVRRK